MLSAARRILILAPHPDDEIVACGISAQRARVAGAQVFVLYLTSGVPEAAAPLPWRRSKRPTRSARRYREALAAAALFGLETVGFRGRRSNRRVPARCALAAGIRGRPPGS